MQTPAPHLYDLHHSINEIDAALATTLAFLEAISVMLPTEEGRDQLKTDICSVIHNASSHCSIIESRLSWMIEPTRTPRPADLKEMNVEGWGPVYAYGPHPQDIPGRRSSGNVRFFLNPIDHAAPLIAQVEDHTPDPDEYVILDTSIPRDTAGEDLDTAAHAFITKRLGAPAPS